jgi:hypothetical protein
VLVMDPLYQWATGMTFSVIVGGIVTCAFLEGLRRYQKLGKDSDGSGDSRPVPPWLRGVMERAFFSVIVALNISGAAIAMIAWLTLKMVTNWNRPGGSRDLKEIRLAFSALLAGLVSMGFAIVGGVICRGSPGP